MVTVCLKSEYVCEAWRRVTTLVVPARRVKTTRIHPSSESGVCLVRKCYSQMQLEILERTRLHDYLLVDILWMETFMHTTEYPVDPEE